MNSDLIKLKEKNALLEDEINKAGENFNQFKSFYNETVCNWSERNVKSWAKKDNSTKGVNEVLAVVYRAMELTRNFKPHIIQILTVLMLVHKDPKVGRLAQVLTGEGKSWVIAILVAILKITKRCKVDIVTSSEVLAKRDAKQWETFFKLLNITSSHNIDEKEGPKDCYTHDVVYGTAHTFQADILRDEYKQAGTLNGRTSDVIIVDEVDNMLIDEHNKSTLLSDEKHGFEKLTYVFNGIF
jgi:preprotein translocase subunit SecA